MFSDSLTVERPSDTSVEMGTQRPSATVGTLGRGPPKATRSRWSFRREGTPPGADLFRMAGP